MPPYTWAGDPLEKVREFQVIAADAEAMALISWAVWSVDSLHYLADYDARFAGASPAFNGHTAETVDVAHARWASMTCVTALDLCAASLGRAYAADLRGHHEFDLESLMRKARKKKWYQFLRRIEPVARDRLPSSATAWVHGSRGDARYRVVKYARDRLTHHRLPRHLSVGGQPRRLRLSVRDQDYPVRELVEMARDLATERVESFVEVVKALAGGTAYSA